MKSESDLSRFSVESEERFEELDSEEKAKMQEILDCLGLDHSTYTVTDIILAIIRKIDQLHK